MKVRAQRIPRDYHEGRKKPSDYRFASEGDYEGWALLDRLAGLEQAERYATRPCSYPWEPDERPDPEYDPADAPPREPWIPPELAIPRAVKRRDGKIVHRIKPRFLLPGQYHSTIGQCVCGRPIYETGDYRGSRYRHGLPYGESVLD